MCGIAGVWQPGDSHPVDPNEVVRMCDSLAHRGPDDAGVWWDPAAGVALGHRRLAIVDLSRDGHQPMVSNGGRYVVTFNGEIYNFPEIRRRLPAGAFRGHSDTEVLLAAIETWGLDRALESATGMFAFALWDRAERCLHLVRDRLGIKPLYYAWIPGGVIFASEVSALESYPGFDTSIDPAALALLLRHKCIPAPSSIFSNARKLEPAAVMTIRDPGRRSEMRRRFWHADALLQTAVRAPSDEQEAEDALDQVLRAAVGRHMVGDVPVGAFLSGGIDSTLVVALMQATSREPVRTFTIGFEHAQYDERAPARSIATALGTQHEEVVLTAAEATAMVERLAFLADEPFADSSQIPTHLVAAIARSHVKVALSGDGGDELFGGYNRHVWGPRVWATLRRTPRPARRLARRVVSVLSEQTWDRLLTPLGYMNRRVFRHRTPGKKLYKLMHAVDADSVLDLYVRLSTLWTDPTEMLLSAESGTALVRTIREQASELEAVDCPSAMMYLDLITYLPNDILTKLDRATMAVGLEARVPLLDHRVVEYAWTLPSAMNVRDGRGKWLLRRLLGRYIDSSIMDRPKAGFGVPLGAWLRGPLRDWAEELLDVRRLTATGHFNVTAVRTLWNDVLSGYRPLEYHIWPILMAQAWFCRRDGRALGKPMRDSTRVTVSQDGFERMHATAVSSATG